MELTATDLEELAGFFSRRIDVALTPVPPPSTDDQARQRQMAWLIHLEEAQESHRLSAIVLRVSRQFPDDPTLQSACRLLTDPGRGGDRILGLAVLGVAAAMMITTATAIGAAAGSVYLSTAPQSPPPGSFAATLATPVTEIGEDGRESPLRKEIPATRCVSEDAGLVGYWYAGAEAPAAPGEALVLDRMINVRSDYPDRHNDFDARSRVRCVLRPGDRVTVSGPPIRVPGDAYWVPLRTGDLEAG